MKVKELTQAAPSREVLRFKKDEIDRFISKVMLKGIVTIRYTVYDVCLIATARRRLLPNGIYVRTRSYTTNTIKVWFSTRRGR